MTLAVPVSLLQQVALGRSLAVLGRQAERFCRTQEQQSAAVVVWGLAQRRRRVASRCCSSSCHQGGLGAGLHCRAAHAGSAGCLRPCWLSRMPQALLPEILPYVLWHMTLVAAVCRCRGILWRLYRDDTSIFDTISKIYGKIDGGYLTMTDVRPGSFHAPGLWCCTVAARQLHVCTGGYPAQA